MKKEQNILIERRNRRYLSVSLLRRLALATCGAGIALSSTSALATGTVAGTDIVNVAQATYNSPGGSITIDSNIVTIKVDELLDVTVVSSDPGDVVTGPERTAQILTYQVTNTGNGSEAFTLSADTAKPGDEFDTNFEQIVLDTNDNGVYDAGVDTVYTAGTNDPVLAPDESVTVFILSAMPATAKDGERAEVELAAVANTGSGAPGDVFAGEGDGGSDAVVGSTGADAEDSGFFLIEAAEVTLVKSATIVDPFGGSEPVPGAVITYQLVATTVGTGSLADLGVTDIVPENTTYTSETITLDGAPLTDDSTDTDVGSFDGTAIAVGLGTVPGGQTRTITFQVTID
ncbi:hypothetical protein [Parasphingorhabdus sp.]|uniref:hypothetical protein n=1 Tax=Parasphingorhabdus sp. TaxID=2709688 RepID=UPI003D2BE5B8